MCTCVCMICRKLLISVEYCVLLESLFSVGANGRMWWLLRCWYDNVRCRVCMNGNLSSDFIVQRALCCHLHCFCS